MSMSARSASVGSEQRRIPPPPAFAALDHPLRAPQHLRADPRLNVIPASSRHRVPTLNVQSLRSSSATSHRSISTVATTKPDGAASVDPRFSDPPPAGTVRASRRASFEPPAHPKHTNFRGYYRCRWCNVFVVDEAAAAATHEAECPFVPLECGGVDSETGERCAVIAKGRQLLERHRRRCPMRLVECSNAGCHASVSLQSLSQHLHACSQALVRCVACHAEHPRSAEALHETYCPEVTVRCPLGCGAEMRRNDVPVHIRDKLLDHPPRQSHNHEHVSSPLHPADSPDVIVALLLRRIHEQHATIQRLRSGQQAVAAAASVTPQRRRSTTVDSSAPHPSFPPATADGDSEANGHGGRDADARTAAVDGTPARQASGAGGDETAFELSPFSPVGAGSVGPVSRTVFAALVAASDVASVALEQDTRQRALTAQDLTLVLLEALRAHRFKSDVLANADVASGRATVADLRAEMEGAVARAHRLWGLCGLAGPKMSDADTPAWLRPLRDAAARTHRAFLEARCALYDCM